MSNVDTFGGSSIASVQVLILTDSVHFPTLALFADSFARATNHENLIAGILGDPGAVSGGREKSKQARKKFGRRKVKKENKLLFSFLTFLRPNFFLACLDFFLPPLTAPGSPRMDCRLILPKNTTQCPQPEFEHELLDLESSALTMRPLHLPKDFC